MQAARRGRGLSLLAGFCLGSGFSGAVEIRTYSAERHDRFTGYPSAPAFNGSAYYESSKYTGVAWVPGETNSRQFALVTPLHAVFARHYAPGPGTPLRFLNADGETVDRVVGSVDEILNGDSQPTDLVIVSLTVPLAEADKVSFFPYLNLASESAYLNTTLTVFGWDAKAGRSSVHGFEDSDIPGINATRLMRFRYAKLFGNQDDARVVTGDSGSPTFATAAGNPAIVGIHTAAGESGTHYHGYDAFIPHYIAEIDALIELSGYRMTPVYPPVVTWSASHSVPQPLRQLKPGVCRFMVQNSGVNDAGNARVTLLFPAGAEPTSVDAPDWIVERNGPAEWVLRCAKVGAGATSEIEALWSAMPVVSSIPVEMTRVADGAPSAVQNFTLSIAPTFAAWAVGLAETGVDEDPDRDGVSNLLEYALGGDPESGVMVAEPAGVPLTSAVAIEDGTVSVRFQVREDAAVRGLTYTPEFSPDLENWSAIDVPEDLEDGTDVLLPEGSGFLLRTLSWDVADPRRFFRLRVTLDE